MARSRLRTTPAPARRLTDRVFWDEPTRPQAPPAPAGHVHTDRERAAGEHLVDVHDHLRGELAHVRELIGRVERGTVPAGAARSAIHRMSVGQGTQELGVHCAVYCRVVTTHHTLEDDAVFPRLRAADPGLGPVIERLAEEHLVIAAVLEDVDRALVAHLQGRTDLTGLRRAVDELTDALLSHLAYEEQQLVEPLARLGPLPGPA